MRPRRGWVVSVCYERNGAAVCRFEPIKSIFIPAGARRYAGRWGKEGSEVIVAATPQLFALNKKN